MITKVNFIALSIDKSQSLTVSLSYIQWQSKGKNKMQNGEFFQNSGMGRVCVHEGSAYAHLNGQVFPIVETTSDRVTLDINGLKHDFYHSEVSVYTASMGWVICSLAKEWGLYGGKDTPKPLGNEFTFVYIDPITDEAFLVEARVTREPFNEEHEGGYESHADLLRIIDRSGAIRTPYTADDQPQPDWAGMELAAIEEYNHPSHRRCAWPELPSPKPLAGTANLVAAKVRMQLPADSLPIVYPYQDGSDYGLRGVTAIEKWLPDTYVVSIEAHDGDISWTAVQAELETAARVHALERALEHMLELTTD